ncbi:RHS domain-containing protein [Acidovorax sp. LjRoot117]|uniref:RHS domain-containing protein n=1 Tax=Acidovorax sp. LjRoot117 TaxID=3342255 RepID=UPI003F4FB193
MGLPEELSNAQGQLVWQAQYKTWGRTVEERWEARRLHGAKVQGQTQGDIPGENRQEQNLRCSTRNNVVSRVKNIIQRRCILKFRRYQMTG